jgi:molecular chaperone GrpE
MVMISDPNHLHEEMFASQQPDDFVEQPSDESSFVSGEASGDLENAIDRDAELVRLQVELAEANDRTIRAHAELENFRKRVYREMQDERKYASMPLLRGLLPVVDNLQRAIRSAEQNPDVQGLLEGVQLVSQQLDAVFQQHHCTVIDAKGKLFDPHLHEAVAQLPNRDVPQGGVIEVTLAGYVLHDRVVRAAQVLVSAGPPADSTDSE